MTGKRRLLTAVILLTMVPVCPVFAQETEETEAYSISGSVGAPDVRMQGLPGSVKSDAQGRYIAQVLSGWTGIVRPEKEGYTFAPLMREYDNVNRDFTDQDYTERPLVGPPVPRSDELAGFSQVTIIPSAQVQPRQFATLSEDVRIMLHIIEDGLEPAREGEAGLFMDFGDFFGREQKESQAIYIQGYGALFLLEANLRLALGPPRSQQSNQSPADEPGDPVWRRAKEKLYPSIGMRRSQQQAPPRTLDDVKADLIQTLKHASNIRGIDPNEWVIVMVASPLQPQSASAYGTGGYGGSGDGSAYGTSGYGGSGGYSGGGYGMGGYGGASGQSSGGMMGAYGGGASARTGRGGMMGGGMGASGATAGRTGSGASGGMMGGYGRAPGGGGSGSGMMGDTGMGGGMGMGGFGGSAGPTQSSPVTITIRAKKADIDDFAEGTIEYEQFKTLVNTFAY